MKNSNNNFGVILLGCFCSMLLFSACAPKGAKKSQRFYLKNEKSIAKTFQLYADLYHTQPLSLGFNDRSFKYPALEIKTDTQRYVLSTEQSSYIFPLAVEAFKYDTIKLRQVYDSLRSLRCFWMGADKAYGKEKSYNTYFLSFGSVIDGNPFLDRKYFNVVWIDPMFLKENPEMDPSRKGFYKIKNNVYYAIMDHYR
ncbi:MAG: hypothetical protein EAZ62_05680 [Sphingobacteriia bacterium]|nr:MAG: hypothetical protein EAZ62_05680 [Sphingobacteriia bacterium]